MEPLKIDGLLEIMRQAESDRQAYEHWAGRQPAHITRVIEKYQRRMASRYCEELWASLEAGESAGFGE